MGWTDERVELLKKLWQDGLSASQIAKQLGGVTRNAVIGKVHRLGLSGRATPSKPAAPGVQGAASGASGWPRRRRRAGIAEPRAGRRTPAPVRYVEEPGHGHGADPGRPHVQVADRRSVDGQLHLLRPPLRATAPTATNTPGRLPAAAAEQALRRHRTGPLAAPVYLTDLFGRPWLPARVGYF